MSGLSLTACNLNTNFLFGVLDTNAPGRVFVDLDYQRPDAPPPEEWPPPDDPDELDVDRVTIGIVCNSLQVSLQCSQL